VSFSWSLVPSPQPGPFVLGASQEATPVYKTKQDFLDLFERILPSSYLVPLKNGDGYALLQAYAAVWERVSLAVGQGEVDLLIGSSHGPSLATVPVSFYRDSAASGAFTLMRGSRVSCSKSGRDFFTKEDAVFGASDLGPVVVEAEAAYPSPDWNVRGARVSAAGELMDGEVDTIVRALQDPAYAEPYLKVRQVADAAGGLGAVLDQLGEDRGLPRAPGESDTFYRGRVSLLPDTVSPAAVRRVLEHFVRQYPSLVPYEMIETFQLDYVTCWDAPAEDDPESGFDTTCFVYDDPRPAGDPFRGRWLSETDYRAAIIVVVPVITYLPTDDLGLAMDDTAMTVAEHLNPAGGRRSVGAMDIPSDLDASMARGAMDGAVSFYEARNMVYVSLYDTLADTVAAGTYVALELRS
jgi:hypothetical protein